MGRIKFFKPLSVVAKQPWYIVLQLRKQAGAELLKLAAAYILFNRGIPSALLATARLSRTFYTALDSVRILLL